MEVFLKKPPSCPWQFLLPQKTVGTTPRPRDKNLLNSPETLWGQTSANQPVTSSGTEFMVPKKEVNGKLIGQEDVLIQEVVITDSDRRYFRLDVGVSGTVAG